MVIKEFLKETAKMTPYGTPEVRDRITCNDGFSMSVQANRHCYCTPRQDLLDGEYKDVEIGFPSQEEELINELAECPSDYTGSVYGYVPIETVEAVIEKHGGMKGERWIKKSMK